MFTLKHIRLLGIAEKYAEYNKAEKALRNFKTQEELGKLLGISSGTINKIMKEYPDYFLKQQTKKTEKEHHY